MAYHVLESAVMRGAVGLNRKFAELRSGKYGAEAPAVIALTDFRFTPAMTVPSSSRAVSALDVMTQANVGALLVERELNIVGLITARDIQHGESTHAPPPAHEPQSGANASLNLKVDDVMSALDLAPSVRLDAFLMSRVGDVQATFESHPEWTHILVVEHSIEGSVAIRGIVSKTRVNRLLMKPESDFGGPGIL